MHDATVVIQDRASIEAPGTTVKGVVIRVAVPDGLSPFGAVRLTESVTQIFVAHEHIKSESCDMPDGNTAMYCATGIGLFERGGAYSVDPDFRSSAVTEIPAIAVWAQCGCARIVIGEAGVRPTEFREQVREEMPRRCALKSRLAFIGQHRIHLLLVIDESEASDLLKRYITGLDPEERYFDCLEEPDINAAIQRIKWADAAIVASSVYDSTLGSKSQLTALDLIWHLVNELVPALCWNPSPLTGEAAKQLERRVREAGCQQIYYGPKYLDLITQVLDLVGIPQVL